jgi:hypothetical protein
VLEVDGLVVVVDEDLLDKPAAVVEPLFTEVPGRRILRSSLRACRRAE